MARNAEVDNYWVEVRADLDGGFLHVMAGNAFQGAEITPHPGVRLDVTGSEVRVKISGAALAELLIKAGIWAEEAGSGEDGPEEEADDGTNFEQEAYYLKTRAFEILRELVNREIPVFGGDQNYLALLLTIIERF